MALGGAFLRFGSIGLRILQFGCAAIILGIYSYFLAVLANHNLHIPAWEKAVEGMSGAAVLYTIFGVLFTLCLGGVAFFGFLAVLLDICFVGAFAAIAYYTRHGANSCKGFVRTPIGDNYSNVSAPGAGHYSYACSLNTACFAISIVAIFLFLVSAAVQVMMVRHHKKEKRYGPSPSNNYTKGSGRRPFWRRNKKVHSTRDAELATGGAVGTAGAIRPSHETGNTLHDNTYAPTTTEPKFGQPGYGQPGYGQTHYSNHASTNY